MPGNDCDFLQALQKPRQRRIQCGLAGVSMASIRTIEKNTLLDLTAINKVVVIRSGAQTPPSERECRPLSPFHCLVFPLE